MQPCEGFKKTFEIFASGFRNIFDGGVNHDGEAEAALANIAIASFLVQ